MEEFGNQINIQFTKQITGFQLSNVKDKIPDKIETIHNFFLIMKEKGSLIENDIVKQLSEVSKLKKRKRDINEFENSKKKRKIENENHFENLNFDFLFNNLNDFSLFE